MKVVLRYFIYLLVVLSIACVAQEKVLEKTEAFVPADIAPLKKVIVLSPGEDFSRQSYEHYSDNPYFGITYDSGAVEQHKNMVDILEENDVEVFNVLDLLEDAIIKAREAGKLEESLQEIFPATFLQIKENIDQIDAQSILGRQDIFYFCYDEDGRFLPLIEPPIAFFFTRDFAAATPKGLILTNSKLKSRLLEHEIGRFMFNFAEELKDCSIAFDAEKEGVRCEGGDIIVKDEHTILMGIHNLSQAEAAQKIAQMLDMDVYGVSMPPFEDFSGANVEIMHLDTVFNLVDEKKALTVPYLFEKEYVQNNPMVKLLESVNKAIELKKKRARTGSEWFASYSMAIKQIPDVGWLTHYKAGTGEAAELKIKLVDYLRGQGYEIIWVGGDKGDLREDKYLLERVMYELSMQAANVVQLAPGKVLSYAHNSFTIQTLRDNGIEVIPFEGKYLADNLGGPHCLTMPLLRRY
jgi:arginine deiminase